MVDKLSKTLDPIRTGPATGTALGEAQAQFDRVANRLRLDPATTALLRTPMREHHFVIPVRMDDGTSQMFRGIRVQHNDARGPYKGGIRFHPATTVDDVRALAMLMTWNAPSRTCRSAGRRGRSFAIRVAEPGRAGATL